MIDSSGRNIYTPGSDGPSPFLLYYGKQACPPGHSYGPAVRDHYVFKYVRKGRGILRIDDRTFHVGPREGFVLFPDHLLYYEADRKEPWEYFWVAFTGEPLPSYLEIAGITPKTPLVPFRDQASLEGLYRRLLSHPRCDSAAPDAFGKGMLYLVFAEILQNAVGHSIQGDATVSRYEKNKIQTAVHFMTVNYAADISVAQIAAHTGLERSHFSRLFRETTGKSPRDYLLEYRLTRAATLLAETDISVEHIALSVGFNTPLYFSRIFKKHAGCTPTEFRNRDTEHKRFVFSEA